jgi:hypothetical protein
LPHWDPEGLPPVPQLPLSHYSHEICNENGLSFLVAEQQGQRRRFLNGARLLGKQGAYSRAAAAGAVWEVRVARRTKRTSTECCSRRETRSTLRAPSNSPLAAKARATMAPSMWSLVSSLAAPWSTSQGQNCVVTFKCSISVKFEVNSAGNWRFPVIVLDSNVLGSAHFEEPPRHVEVDISASCMHGIFAIAILCSRIAIDSAYKIQPLISIRRGGH